MSKQLLLTPTLYPLYKIKSIAMCGKCVISFEKSEIYMFLKIRSLKTSHYPYSPLVIHYFLLIMLSFENKWIGVLSFLLTTNNTFSHVSKSRRACLHEPTGFRAGLEWSARVLHEPDGLATMFEKKIWQEALELPSSSLVSSLVERPISTAGLLILLRANIYYIYYNYF